jgi:hypothetical protein
MSGSFKVSDNGSGIAEGGVYLHNSPSETQKFNVVQLLISGTSASTFGNTLLAAGVFKQQIYVRRKNPRKRLRYAYFGSST